MSQAASAPTSRRLVLTVPLCLGLGACGALSSFTTPDAPPPTAVPTALFEVVADRRLNPDEAGRPKPVMLRLYELRATAAFDRSGYLELQDKDESQLGGDSVKREEFVLQPGEQRTLERKGNPDVRAFGFLVGYRDLEHSLWRTTIDAPNSVEMRRRWWGLGPTERLKPVTYLVTLSRDAVKVEIKPEAK
ncbi:MAG: type VI secretion system lipoprotein TssJ [Curvibacter sp.]|nr:type VI secretion system lipoprotein TssJ [Curvibacter sp.]